MAAAQTPRHAAWQLAEDRRRAGGLPSLLAVRRERMLASPHAFLRGSAALFYHLLAEEPELAAGPPGEGWIIGDAHLENFGAYRCDTLGEDDDKHLVAFDINDFDDATRGPLRFDVLRLLCSVLLAGPELRLAGRQLAAVAWAVLDGHGEALFGGRAPTEPPKAVAQLMERVARRGRAELLANRTELRKEERRFVRGPRYQDLSPELEAAARLAFAGYVRSLGREPDSKPLQIVDLARRIAGTGSLGCLRVAVLVRGKGGPNGHWIFDLKEVSSPSSVPLLGEPPGPPAERVLEATRRLLAQPPRLAGAATLDGISMFGRRLAPQEDRLELAALPPETLRPVGFHLGALFGAAHRRGLEAPVPAWSAAEQRALYDQAASLAGTLLGAFASYAALDDPGDGG